MATIKAREQIRLGEGSIGRTSIPTSDDVPFIGYGLTDKVVKNWKLLHASSNRAARFIFHLTNDRPVFMSYMFKLTRLFRKPQTG